jgi:Zn-dependent peptidase ImmA (M78 family)
VHHAEAVARTMLRQLGLITPPVDVNPIAEKLGLAVTYAALSGLSGSLVRYAGKELIVININEPQQRQRFSLAHEIGHSQLRHGGLTFACILEAPQDTAPIRKVEREASRFAAALLMPEWMVRQDYFSGSSNEEIARHFGVSVEAVYWRLQHLGLARNPYRRIMVD